MVYEWVPVELYGANNDGSQRRYTITDGVAVSKGTVLALLDPRTASVAVLASAVFAGVAAEDHLPNIGVTTISAWTDGVFEVTCSAAIAVGNPFTGTGGGTAPWNNCIIPALTSTSGAATMGYALETGSALETINVRLSL